MCTATTGSGSRIDPDGPRKCGERVASTRPRSLFPVVPAHGPVAQGCVTAAPGQKCYQGSARTLRGPGDPPARPRRPPAQPRRSCCAVPATLLRGLGDPPAQPPRSLCVPIHVSYVTISWLLRGPGNPPAHPFVGPIVRSRGFSAVPAPSCVPSWCRALPCLDACAWPLPLLHSLGVRVRGASVSLRPCDESVGIVLSSDPEASVPPISSLSDRPSARRGADLAKETSHRHGTEGTHRRFIQDQ